MSLPPGLSEICLIETNKAVLEGRAALFAHRVSDHRIRDCHGDLRLQHVYVLDGQENAASRLAILDCIEFNERFRYSDVASEVTFSHASFSCPVRSPLYPSGS